MDTDDIGFRLQKLQNNGHGCVRELSGQPSTSYAGSPSFQERAWRSRLRLVKSRQ